MRHTQPTPEQEAAWKEWVASRPDHVRVVAEHFEPWHLYRLSTTGHRVLVIGFDEMDEGVRVRIAVLGRYNAVVFDRQVFGIDPATLTPCDPPSPDEPVGTLLTKQEDVDQHLDHVRSRLQGVQIKRSDP
jgi:hypothetical protein